MYVLGYDSVYIVGRHNCIASGFDSDLQTEEDRMIPAKALCRS
jgi:hypothetical protein